MNNVLCNPREYGFAADVCEPYFLFADDVVNMGGTLAELADYIQKLVDRSVKTVTNKPFGLSLSKASIGAGPVVRQAHRER